MKKCVCGQLGVFDPYSDIPPPAQKQTFILGNGKYTRNPEEANEWYLNRDFPKYSFQDGQQKEVLFAPPIHFGQRPDLQEVDPSQIEHLDAETKLKVRNEMSQGQFEEKIIQEIKSCLSKQKDKNVTVLFGWRRQWCQLLPKPPKDKIGEEHDVLIIDGRNRTLIMIEIKGTSHIDKAAEQLKAQQEYIKEYHGHVLKGWKMVSCIAAASNIPICEKCKPFTILIDKELGIDDWWDRLQTTIGKNGPWGDENSYKRIVGLLLGLSVTAKAFHSNIAKCFQQIKVDATGSADNLSGAKPKTTKIDDYPQKKDPTGVSKTFFLSEDQGKILRGMAEDLVLLHGPPGVGKTLILKYKAMQMLEADKVNKIIYLIGAVNDSANSFEFFLELTKQDFKKEIENGRLSVTAKKSLNENEMIDEHNKGTHIFIDECESRDAFGLLDCKKKEGTKIWISSAPVPEFTRPRVLRSPNKFIDNEERSSFENNRFKFIELKKNFRNKKEIQLFVKNFCSEEEYPKKYPNNNTVEENRFTDAKEKLNIEEVDKYKLPVLIVIKNKSKFQDAFEKALEMNDQGPFPVLVIGKESRRLEVPEGWTNLSIMDYSNNKSNLRNNGKTLMMTKNLFDHGIESTVVIFFNPNSLGFFYDDPILSLSAMLRAISHLTIICISDNSKVANAIKRVEGLAHIEKI